MFNVTTNIIDVDLDQVHSLTPAVINQAVDAMLHDPSPGNRQEGFFFVQILLQQSMLTVHEKLSSYLGLEIDKWVNSIPGAALDQLMQERILAVDDSTSSNHVTQHPDDGTAASTRLANYLWITVSNRDDFD